MADESDRIRPLLEAVGVGEVLDLIFSLIEATDEEKWLQERLANALRD
jgi:hypothetical protein